ncbi:MAG: hypothetical protein M3063_06475, partial [Actinomycetota bacterium]|nr:hypothetical protein [Actinomycetota bacterium]
LNPLRPDRLGEALIATCLRSRSDGGSGFLDKVVGLSSDEQVAHCLGVLARCTASDPDIAIATTTVLAARHEQLVARAKRQARGTADRPGQLSLVKALLRLLAGNLAQGLASAEPGNTTYQRDLSISYNNLADLAGQAGHSDEAERLYRQGLTIRQGLASAEPRNTTYQRDLSISYERLGVISGGPEDSCTWFRRAVDARRGIFRSEPNRVDLAEELGVALRLLGGVTEEPGGPQHELTELLEPFEGARTITHKGATLLRWARGTER